MQANTCLGLRQLKQSCQLGHSWKGRYTEKHPPNETHAPGSCTLSPAFGALAAAHVAEAAVNETMLLVKLHGSQVHCYLTESRCALLSQRSLRKE